MRGKVIYQAKGVIQKVQKHSHSSVVVVVYERDDSKFVNGEGAISAIGKLWTYYKKWLTAGFSYHYHSCEVDESEIAGLSKISDLYSYHPLGIYNIKDSVADYFLVSFKVSLYFLVSVLV